MHALHLIEGPVGAGKSTFAKALAERRSGVHIALDEWFARLFSPDRPGTDILSWYVPRKARLADLLWDHAVGLARANAFAVLELGLIQREARSAIYQKARAEGVQLKIFVLDAPREMRWRRVEQRNEERGPTFSMVVPRHIFETASDLWEPPDEDEAADQDIEFLPVPHSPDDSDLDVVNER